MLGKNAAQVNPPDRLSSLPMGRNHSSAARPSRPPSAVAALALAAAGATAGCQSAPLAPVQVQVLDPSRGEPIHDAAVFAESLARDHPFSIATLLGQTGARRDEGRTDDAGRVQLTFIADRPLRIGILAPGYAPLIRLLDPAPPAGHPVEFTTQAEQVGRPASVTVTIGPMPAQ